MLATRSGSPVRINAQVCRIDIDFPDVFHFRQYRDSAGRSMDPALRLCCRDSLNPVRSPFKLKPGKRTLSDNADDNFLEPAMISGALAEYFDRPAMMQGAEPIWRV